QQPGRYPRGNYPPGDPRNDPRNDPRSDPTNQRGGRGRRTANDKGKAAIPVTTTGIFRKAGGSQFAFEAEAHRTLRFLTNGQTVIRKEGKAADPGAFQPGDHMTVESLEDDEGIITPTSVRFDKAGTATEKAAAAEIWDLPRLDRKPATAAS